MSLDINSYNLLIILSVMIILDIFTGFTKAFYLGDKSDKALESRVMSKGILRKMLIYVVVALAYLLELIYGGNIPIMTITIMYYIVNESISILENVGQCITLPEIITKRIEVLKNSISQKGNNDAR